MPGGDKTGPNGAGPMTGRGAGFCSGNDVPGSMNPSFRGEFGGGGGRGRRNQYYATGRPRWGRGQNWDNMPNSAAPQMESQQKMSEQKDVRYLKDQVKNLSQMMEQINSKLDELSNKKDS